MPYKLILFVILNAIPFYTYSVDFELGDDFRKKLYPIMRAQSKSQSGLIDPLICRRRGNSTFFIFSSGNRSCIIFTKPQDDFIFPDVYTLINLSTTQIRFVSVGGSAILEPNEYTVSFGRFILDAVEERSPSNYIAYSLNNKLKDKVIIIGNSDKIHGVNPITKVTKEKMDLYNGYLNDAVIRNELTYVEVLDISEIHGQPGLKYAWGHIFRVIGTGVMFAAKGAITAALPAAAASLAKDGKIDYVDVEKAAIMGAVTFGVERYTKNIFATAAALSSMTGACYSCHPYNNTQSKNK